MYDQLNIFLCISPLAKPCQSFFFCLTGFLWLRTCLGMYELLTVLNLVPDLAYNYRLRGLRFGLAWVNSRLVMYAICQNLN